MAELVSIDPSTGDVVGRVPTADPSVIPETMITARAAQEAWARESAGERGARVAAMAAALEARADEVAHLNTRETGRTPELATAGVAAAVATLRQYAELGPLHHSRGLNGNTDALDMQVPEPRGVAAVITPWNDPVAIAAGLIGAALATGNAVVHKPSERAPLVGALVGEILAEPLPNGLLLTLSGGPALGDELCRSEQVDVIAHVGSSATGERIARLAALTGAHVIRENGGNDPLIVDEGVDVADAAAQAALGSFINAGQLCTSVERIYVHRAIADEFTERLVDAAEAFRSSPMFGPLVDERMRATVHDYVEDAVALGARVLTGGEVSAGPSTTYPPTVLADCTSHMRVMREEVFGPVAPIQMVDSFEEAIALANADDFGLAATVLSTSTSNCLAAARELNFGTVKINAVFGGAPGGSAEPRRRSGSGFGYGPLLLDEFTAVKVVHFEDGLVPG